MAALVNCIVMGGDSHHLENGTSCSFYVPLPLVKGCIEKMFPFDGAFQFRVKIDGKYLSLQSTSSRATTVAGNESHDDDELWLDMNQGDTFEDIGKFVQLDEENGSSVIHVKATLLSLINVNLPDNADNVESDYASYLESVGHHMILEDTRRLSRLPINITKSKNALEKGTLSGMAVSASNLFKFGTATLSALGESVGRDAGSLWSGVTSMFGMTAASSSLPENIANNLNILSGTMSTSVTDDALFTLWDVMNLDKVIGYPESTNIESRYARKTQQWKCMGWQKDDPALDLRTSGTLAIRCMTHFAKTQPDVVMDMLGTYLYSVIHIVCFSFCFFTRFSWYFRVSIIFSNIISFLFSSFLFLLFPDCE